MYVEKGNNESLLSLIELFIMYGYYQLNEEKQSKYENDIF